MMDKQSTSHRTGEIKKSRPKDVNTFMKNQWG